ncbi:MAG: 8-amino-7-oxononanoate synthase [Pseudomonadales bacterium]|nr:8-amino-7-oxononanoate synthase [Pseudomonadales bacterium]MCP5216141.1 8-amino-7-oxononanoate synthase [Pseudomonadales bacterium]
MKGFATLAADLARRKQEHLYRTRLVTQSPQGAEIIIAGKKFLNFCSNDYLGLANHPDVISAFQRGAQDYGVGSGASHLVNGHSHYHYQLEEALAEFTGRPRALLFSTGYMANLGAVTSLLGKGDGVFEDRLNHASLLDAGILSRANFQRYRHGDMEELSSRLEKFAANRKLIISDGVFSMDGDLAPLPQLLATAKKQNAWLMIDDAHGLGCVGKKGRGVCEHFGVNQEDVQVLVGTLGKSFGTAGAFVAGSEVLIETLIQQARTYIYTTALPPAVAAATLVSLKLVEQDSWRREHLVQLITMFRRGAQARGLSLMTSQSPIQPVLVGSSAEALAMSEALKVQGVLVTAIRPPTVPAGTARLRVTLSAAHSSDQVEQLLDALGKAKLNRE